MFPIPSALVTLLLRHLPPLPPDPSPTAAWSDTSTRRVVSSLAESVTQTAGLPDGLAAVLRTYSASASDGQLAWLVDQLALLTAELTAARAADAARDRAQLDAFAGG